MGLYRTHKPTESPSSQLTLTLGIERNTQQQIPALPESRIHWDALLDKQKITFSNQPQQQTEMNYNPEF